MKILEYEKKRERKSRKKRGREIDVWSLKKFLLHIKYYVWQNIFGSSWRQTACLVRGLCRKNATNEWTAHWKKRSEEWHGSLQLRERNPFFFANECITFHIIFLVVVIRIATNQRSWVHPTRPPLAYDIWRLCVYDFIKFICNSCIWVGTCELDASSMYLNTETQLTARLLVYSHKKWFSHYYWTTRCLVGW